MSKLDALYMSDFFIKNRNTLNTLCLFYDRVFLHDYFGIFICVNSKEDYEQMQNKNEEHMRWLWSIARGLDEETKLYLKSACDTEFDAFVLKGVAQGLGCQTGTFSPTFVVKFARKYASFLRENYVLFTEDVLMLCETSRNPFHPVARLEGGVKLDLRCSEKENQESLAKSRLNNKRACLFEQEYHKLPLVSDSEEDLIPWDRTKDLLTTALILAAIPSKVPTIAQVPAEAILEAREKLKDLLPPFRTAMQNAAWEVAKASRETSMNEVVNLAKLYYGTQIEPTITDIEEKLKSENAKLHHKLLERGIDKTVLLAKALDPSEPYSKWELLASGLKSVLDIDESRRIAHEIKSPYEFLVQLPKTLRLNS